VRVEHHLRNHRPSELSGYAPELSSQHEPIAVVEDDPLSVVALRDDVMNCPLFLVALECRHLTTVPVTGRGRYPQFRTCL